MQQLILVVAVAVLLVLIYLVLVENLKLEEMVVLVL
jgi:hypothetical protein